MDEKINEQWCHATETKRPSKQSHMLMQNWGKSQSLYRFTQSCMNFIWSEMGLNEIFAPHIIIGKLLIDKQDGE